MNKHLRLSLSISFLLFFIAVPLQAQTEAEAEEDCEDCPTEVEVRQNVTTPKKVVAPDSLYLLQDRTSEVNNKKFDAKFKNKYREEQAFTYVQEEKKDSLLDQIKRAIKDWFRRNFMYKVTDELNNFYYVVFLRVLGFFILGLVIYYLVKAFIQKDIYWIIKKKGKKINALENISAADFKTTNFEMLIAAAIEQQEFRLAIRLYYLLLLQRLQEQNKIIWAPEKTNADYSYELKEEQERQEFSYLSYLYNNIWYGEHTLTSEDFLKAKHAFDLKLKNK